MIVYVVRSYVNEPQKFGDIQVRANHFTEVSPEVIRGLSAEDKAAMKRARELRRISVQMVSDGKPVHEMNEQFVLQRQSDNG